MININKMSDSEYQEYCLKEYKDFFKQLEKEISKDLKDLKMIYYFEGKTLIVKPTINISVRESSLFSKKRMLIEGAKIPDNFKIFGIHLVISDYPEETLPDNLYVDNSLFITLNRQIRYFGKNTLVGGSLYATHTGLESLDNFKFIDCSYLEDCKTAKEIQDKIKGTRFELESYIYNNNSNLDISYSNVKKLPDGLKIRGNLDISGTEIEYIGKSTTICGNFFAHYSLLKDFPIDIQFSNDTNIYMHDVDIKLLKSFKNKKFVFYITRCIKNIDILYKSKSGLQFCTYFIGKDFFENYALFICDNFPKNRIILEKQIFETEKNRLKELNKNNNNYHDENEKRFQEYIKNMLLYYNTIPIRKKLLLEDFENITQKEIDRHINISSKIYKKYNKNKYKKARIYKKSNKINGLHRRIQFGKLINFCRSLKSMKFIYENGYNFNKLEYNSLLDEEVKKIYLKFLLKKEFTSRSNNKTNYKKKIFRADII